MLSFVDRQILVLLVQPIKADLHISDTQMGLLLGFAFVMFYAFLSIPIARLADVHSRRLIIGCGVAVWSVMTALCGIAHNYWQLFIARMGVGAGEACNGPATFSIVADSFPPEKLAKATSVISSGFYIGSGAALIVGGAIIEAVTRLPNFVLPVIGEIRPWQATFLIVGLPGVLVAALMTTVHEPARRGMIQRAADAPAGRRQSLPLRDILQWLRDDWKTYLPMYGGMALRALTGLGSSVWLPTFFIRTYGWSTAEVGLALGSIMLICSPAGLVTGGIIAEKLVNRGYDDANMRVTLISTIISVPLSVLFPLMPGPYLALAVYAVNNFLVSLSPGPQNAALQTVTPNQIRAQATAMYLFLFNLIGFGLGPLVIAAFTDYLFHSEAAIGYSISLSFAIFGPVACLVFWYGLKPYRDSVRRARARINAA